MPSNSHNSPDQGINGIIGMLDSSCTQQPITFSFAAASEFRPRAVSHDMQENFGPVLVRPFVFATLAIFQWSIVEIARV